jgi:hypothetical protein
VLVAGATGTWLALAADDSALTRANATAAGAAVLLLAAGLAVRFAVAIPVAVALLGAEYVALLGVEGGSLDTRAPLVGGALLCVAELAYWSLELRGAVADEAGTYLRRVSLLAALLLGVTCAGVVLLSVVEAVSAEGAVFDLLGALAAVGALTLVALAVRGTAR